MATIYRVARKQVIVLVGSLFLAGTSYFIPIPEQVAPEPSQTERASAASDKALAKPLHGLDIELDCDLDQDEAHVLLTGRLIDRRRFIVGSFNTLPAGFDVVRQPEPRLSGEVDCDKVYVVAGHKGHPEAVKKRP